MRVLFLTHRVPYAPNRGDRARAYHTLRHLASRAEVELVSLAHDQHEAEQIERVREMGARAAAFLVPHLANRVRALPRLAGQTPLTHLLLDAPGIRAALEEIATLRPPDVVLAYCTGMARFAAEPPLDRFPLVVDFVDVDSQKWTDLARSSRWPWGWIYAREARTLATFERDIEHEAFASFVVNEREAALLRQIAPGSKVRVLLNGVEPSAPNGAQPATAPAVAFCGVMNYAPNVEGVLWFARDVWPLVLAARPDARFIVIGANPTAAIRNLAAGSRGIEVTGTVPEVASHLQRCAVSVAPLKIARGVQTKVLEAISLGLPAVVTSPVAEGLPSVIVNACRTADAPDAFARHVIDLLALPAADRRAVAARADLSSLSWERQLAPLMPILSSASQRLRTRGDTLVSPS